MPLYEYHCSRCNQNIELLQRNPEEQSECPECGATNMQRMLSVISIGNSQAVVSNQACDTFGCGKPQCGTGGCGAF